MASRDWIRVLNGIGKVAEQAVRVKGPEISIAKDRFLKHTCEISKLLPHIITNSNDPINGNDNSQSNDTNTIYKAEVPKKETQAFQDTDSAFSTSRPFKTPPTTANVSETSQLSNVSNNANPLQQQTSTSVNQEPYIPAMSVANDSPLPSASAMGTVEAAAETTNIPLEPKELPAWTEKRVPASPIARILGFSSLAARLAMGTATEIVRSRGQTSPKNAVVSDGNVERLTETLCTMRGAALKLGQMLSIQDESAIPENLRLALDRVRQNAHVMPVSQLHGQMKKELGDDWESYFLEFNEVPIAAASIGQVHKAVLSNGDQVAVKVQYPGVAESITSDLLNLKRLVTYTNLLPKGLYINEIIRVGQEELTLECDYKREARNTMKFRQLVMDTEDLMDKFIVPKVYTDISTSRILTTEWVDGVPIDQVSMYPQDIRNSIASHVLELTICELFDWRFMQTDPNWSNFMYNPKTNKIGLVDFGAARPYSEEFVENYFQLVWSAANDDTETLLKYSHKMKFLTGDESPAMTHAHISAGMVVGEPFRVKDNEPFDFYGSQLMIRLGRYTQTFMEGRLTPPPQEVYSLHRKLAGAFLMCIKLRAIIPCRHVLERVYPRYDPKENIK